MTIACEGDNMSARNVWIAFGLGVSAGAAVALLYAPQPGVKTRRQLRKNIDNGVDYLEDAASYLKEQADYLSKEAQQTIKRTRGQVEDVVDKVTGAATGAVKSVQSLM
jgi:gas vesicle protein